MNRYTAISLLALLLLVVGLPVYAWLEPERMEQSQADLRQAFVSDAAVLYTGNCAVCHGAAGEGIGATPALDTEGMRTADYDFLFKTIARGRYGTAMAPWHDEEGGLFNDYQVEELVALVRYGDWSQVRELSAAQGLIPPTLPVPVVDNALLDQIATLDPEGSAWAGGMQLYAANCTICHGLQGEGTSLGVALNTPEVRAIEATELARLITEGVPGTMMVGWDKVLEDEAIAELVAFLQNWDAISEQDLVLTPPEPMQIEVDDPEDMLALGERLFATTCTACHGENGSGGIGPTLNSQQVLTSKTDEQILQAIINGGNRPNSTMPAFGDRLTTTELEALVGYIRAWEPTAPMVENPRGTQQGGGPPWLRATPDPNNLVQPQSGQGNGYRGGANPNFQRGGKGGNSGQDEGQQQQGTVAPQSAPALAFRGQVTAISGNQLAFVTESGQQVEAMLGPPWFWTESGIPLVVGDQIELEGFESTTHMEVNWLTNLTTGQMIRLRTEDGLPVWNAGG
jgi:mono/diheme cytochrome c family protein